MVFLQNSIPEQISKIYVLFKYIVMFKLEDEISFSGHVTYT